jgi:predicted aspartyl protease
MELPYWADIRANLADDSSVPTDVHLATILWNGVERHATVLALGTRPLLGTLLIKGHRLTADFEEAGAVLIERLGSENA